MTLYKTAVKSLPEIHAVIGVWYCGERTYYVKRSEKMANYPGVWSLLSIQFEPHNLMDQNHLPDIQRLMEKMSVERLGGKPLVVRRHLVSGNSDQNPMEKHVSLHLYEIDLLEEPALNPDYYTEGAWLTAEQYEERAAGQPCGLCLRLWSDHAWLMGLTDRPFVSRTAVPL